MACASIAAPSPPPSPAASRSTATPSRPDPVTNAVQDMAFQALEALAFSQLDATVQSRPEGRLGVIFHVKGSFEPKVAQEANVPIADILSGKALKQRVPLPSHTPVDLN